MRVTEQIDAITTMGVSPEQYLVAPRVVATTTHDAAPGDVLRAWRGQLGAYIVAVVLQGIDPGVFFDKIRQFLDVHDLWMMVTKSLVFGLVVSVVCCKKGFSASGGARGVLVAMAILIVREVLGSRVASSRIKAANIGGLVVLMLPIARVIALFAFPGIVTR